MPQTLASYALQNRLHSHERLKRERLGRDRFKLRSGQSVAALGPTLRRHPERRSVEQPQRHVIEKGRIAVVQIQLQFAHGFRCVAVGRTDLPFVERCRDLDRGIEVDFEERSPNLRLKQRAERVTDDHTQAWAGFRCRKVWPVGGDGVLPLAVDHTPPCRGRADALHDLDTAPVLFLHVKAQALLPQL